MSRPVTLSAAAWQRWADARAVKATHSRKAKAFDPLPTMCRAWGLPEPELEVRFHPDRKWRADYLWRAERVILERDGGIVRGGAGGGAAVGGHSSVAGIRRDIEKGNAAQLLGYLFLRAEPRDIERGNVHELLRAALTRDRKGGT